MCFGAKIVNFGAYGENWTRNVYPGTDVKHCFDAV